MIHFSKIVIVGREPKDWNRVDSGYCRFFRQFHRRHRLVDGEHRTAEKADLLPGHDRGCAISQARDICESCRRGIKRLVLPLEDSADPLAADFIVRNLARFLFDPLGEIWGLRVKRLDFWGVCQEIGK